MEVSIIQKEELEVLVKTSVEETLKTFYSHKREKDRWDMYANSSVLLWKSNNCVDIWNHFQKDPDYFMVQYKGIDRFIFHEKMKIDFFPNSFS